MYEVRNLKSPTELPFVGKVPGRDTLSYWAVPAKGDYGEGTQVGRSMAVAYTNYLRGAAGMPPVLPQIVIDMFEGIELPDAVRGQLVGFLSTLETKLVAVSASG